MQALGSLVNNPSPPTDSSNVANENYNLQQLYDILNQILIELRVTNYLIANLGIAPALDPDEIRSGITDYATLS